MLHDPLQRPILRSEFYDVDPDTYEIMGLAHLYEYAFSLMLRRLTKAVFTGDMSDPNFQISREQNFSN